VSGNIEVSGKSRSGRETSMQAENIYASGQHLLGRATIIGADNTYQRGQHLSAALQSLAQTSSPADKLYA
jgi:hypothetical protein